MPVDEWQLSSAPVNSIDRSIASPLHASSENHHLPPPADFGPFHGVSLSLPLQPHLVICLITCILDKLVSYSSSCIYPVILPHHQPPLDIPLGL
jgi:hypothetical protein